MQNLQKLYSTYLKTETGPIDTGPIDMFFHKNKFVNLAYFARISPLKLFSNFLKKLQNLRDDFLKNLLPKRDNHNVTFSILFNGRILIIIMVP